MAAPRRLDPDARRLWRQAERELRERGLWKPTCGPLLERMILNRQAAERALETALASPDGEGSTGQTVAHPMFAVAARCDQVALAIARQLRLTPGTSVSIEGTAPSEKAKKAADPLDELARRRRGSA